jgi:hypothetical protein
MKGPDAQEEDITSSRAPTQVSVPYTTTSAVTRYRKPIMRRSRRIGSPLDSTNDTGASLRNRR